MSKIDELRLGFETAYIDGSVVSNNIYRPQFVSNNHKEGKKVLSSIEDELLVCDGFQISVAFITMNGITPLLQTLKELEKRNIKGEILTTNYLNFSEPKALKKLNELSNITLKILFLTVSKNKIAAMPENIGVVAILTVVLNYSILFPSFTFFLDGFHLAFGDKFEICIKTTDLM